MRFAKTSPAGDLVMMPPGEGIKTVKQKGSDAWARPSPGQCAVYPSTLGVLLPRPSMRGGQHHTTLSIHALVRLPAHAQLSGWNQGEAALSGASADKGQTGLACMSELRLVAYAFGRRLTTGAKEQKEQVVELERGLHPGKFVSEPLAERLCKVDITVPSDLASGHSTPCPLNLELWQHDSLLGDSCMLLVPASMPSVAAEVRSLPCGCDGSEEIEEFVADLGRWQRSHQHVGTAKSTGSPVSKDALGGWEAGALLARQAVVRGMPAVASLLVETLMDLPHPSPTPFMHFACAHTRSCSGSAAAGNTAALGGLLHLALLSPCSTTMLWTVLDWGRQRGAKGDSSTDGTDFAWDWGERNAAGDTPLRLLQQQPKGWSVLQVLLEDPQQGPSVRAATKQQECTGTETSFTQAENPSNMAAAPHNPDTTARHWFDPNTGVWGKLQSAWPNSSIARALGKQHGSSGSEETEFREWVRAQSTPLAKLCFLFNVLHLCTLLLRAVLQKQLHTDMPCLATILVPYAVAAVSSNEAPQMVELLVVLVMLGRLCATLLLSFQLIPVPTSFATVLRLRTEALLEVLVINTMEYVRLSWLLPLRVVLLVGYGLFYRLYGLPHPWLQSLGVHATSFVVSWAVDARYRYIFAKRQHKDGAQLEAAPTAGTPAASPAGEAASAAAVPATAAQSTAQQATGRAAKGAAVATAQPGAEVQGAKGQQEKEEEKHLAGADHQAGAKNAPAQAEQLKQVQASMSSTMTGYLGKLLLEVIGLAFTPLPCMLVAIHLVCEVYRNDGQTLTMALLKALSLGLLLWAPVCVLLHTDHWPISRRQKDRVQQTKAAQGADTKLLPSASPPTEPSAAGVSATAGAAANREGAPQKPQASSVAEEGSRANEEQESGDQPNKLVVVPLYKNQDFAAVDNTEESVRSQESNVRSQLEHINQMVQQKHVYTSRFRRYKVDLKIPGQVDHSLLPADALPQIVSLLSERDFTQRITGTAVRHGCIILSLHMCQEVERQQQQQQEEATQAILAVAQSWLEKTHLADQVPQGTVITLQAGEVQYKLCWKASTHTWTVDGPLPVHEHQQFELRPLLHAAVLPQASQDLSKRTSGHECVQTEGPIAGRSTQQQQQQQEAPKHAGCVLLPIPFSLRSPTGSRPVLTGWTEVTDPAAFAAVNATADDQFMQQPTSTLSVLACVRGRYLPTQVEPLTEAQACRSLSQEDNMGCGAAASGTGQQYQVLVSVPEEVACLPYPQTLHLELWRSWGMLHSCSTLLVPAGLSDVAAEVQTLPLQGPEGDDLGVEPFLLDVADWLQQCSLGQTANSEGHQHHQQHHHWQPRTGSDFDRELCEQGCVLARQAVLWGLPAVASLLVQTLMGLPHPSPTPFMHFARAHTHSRSGNGSAVEDDTAFLGGFLHTRSCSGSAAADNTADLGGLLHLALLSPCSTTMLWTVLDWGKQWATGGGLGLSGKSCIWDWGELNADGVTPQNLLEMRANEAAEKAAVLQQQQQQQPQGANEPAVKAAVLQQQKQQLQGMQAVECALDLMAVQQPPVIKAPTDSSPALQVSTAEGEASTPLTNILPTPLSSEALPTPFSSGLLPTPFSSGTLSTPCSSGMLPTPLPSQLGSPHARVVGCPPDRRSPIFSSTFQQLLGGTSTCSMHSLNGSCAAAGGVDGACGMCDDSVLFSTCLGTFCMDDGVASCEACFEQNSGDLWVIPATTKAASAPADSADPCSSFSGAAVDDAPTQCVHTHPHAHAWAAAECVVQGCAATSVPALQGVWRNSAAVRKEGVSMDIPTDLTARPTTSQQTPRQPSGSAASPATSSASPAVAANTPSQLQRLHASKKQLPPRSASQAALKTNWMHSPKRAGSWLLSRMLSPGILSPRSSVAGAVADEQQLKWGVGCGAGGQHHHPDLHHHHVQQQQQHHLELNAKGRPIQRLVQATPFVQVLLPHNSSTTRTSSTYDSTLGGSMLNSPLTSVQCASTQASQIAPALAPLSPHSTAPVAAHPIHDDGSSTSNDKPILHPPPLPPAAVHSAVSSRSKLPKPCQQACHTGHEESGVPAAHDRVSSAPAGLTNCAGRCGTGRCTRGFAAAPAAAAAAAPASGSERAARADSQETPSTSADPLHKQHHVQDLQCAASAAGGPPYDRAAAAAGATHGLSHLLQGLITEAKACFARLEHGSRAPLVWIRHSLCGFPCGQPSFNACADSTSLVQSTQQQQQQQQGVLQGCAHPPHLPMIAANKATAKQKQQELQQQQALLLQKCGSPKAGCPANLELCAATCMRPRLQQQQDLKCRCGAESARKGSAHVCDSCNANLSAAELCLCPAASCTRLASPGPTKNAPEPCLEEEYRLWCGRQSNQVAFWYCCFNVSNMLVIMAQSFRGGTLLVDMPSVLMWLVPYLCAAITIRLVMDRRMPQVYAEVALICGIIARALSFLGFGASMHGMLELMGPSASALKALSFRTELLNELLLGAIAEQIRLRWLITLRALTVPPLAFYYSGRGCAWPLLQALLVMLLSIASSVSRDICMRRSFLGSRRLSQGLRIYGTCKH